MCMCKTPQYWEVPGRKGKVILGWGRAEIILLSLRHLRPPQGAPWHLAFQFPPHLRCAADALPCIPFSCDLYTKKSSQNDAEMIVNLSQTWIPKEYPYLEEYDQGRSDITKKKGLQHVYEKVTTAAQVHVLKDLILMSCPNGITVSTCADLLNQCQALWPKACEIESYGRRQEQADGIRKVRKTCEKHHHTSVNICHKFGSLGGSPKVILSCFFDCPPEMPSKASPDRFQDQKICQNGGRAAQRTPETPHRPLQNDPLTATEQSTIVPCFWPHRPPPRRSRGSPWATKTYWNRVADMNFCNLRIVLSLPLKDTLDMF
jgi:hypothetical protein